jgi:hypothetical protein
VVIARANAEERGDVPASIALLYDIAMSRKVQRVPYRLDARGVSPLTHDEIVVILRGAHELIGRGGRTQLSKLLKGSREANLLEHGLDRSPSYGFYRDLPLDEVLRRVDWVIQQGFLTIMDGDPIRQGARADRERDASARAHGKRSAGVPRRLMRRRPAAPPSCS